MLKLDGMGGYVVPGTACADEEMDPDAGVYKVWADIKDCDGYPGQVIGWRIASSPNRNIAELIAEAINKSASELTAL